MRTESSQMYDAVFAVASLAGLWEGDAHLVAEQADTLTSWLKHEYAGSHCSRVDVDPPLPPERPAPLADPIIPDTGPDPRRSR